MSISQHLAVTATQNVFSYLLSLGPNYEKSKLSAPNEFCSGSQELRLCIQCTNPLWRLGALVNWHLTFLASFRSCIFRTPWSMQSYPRYTTSCSSQGRCLWLGRPWPYDFYSPVCPGWPVLRPISSWLLHTVALQY